jgi:acetylornithine/N-succinyldiaminopimelate aminotransferase
MTFEEIRRQEQRSMMPVFSRFPVALVSGKGATAVDVNGKEYVDFTAGIGVNSLGYCDPEWSAAVAKQASSIQHLSNLYYSPVQTAAAEKLCELSGMSKVFFANSGAEANECAVKLARKYGQDRLGPGCTEIVTLKNSFHGRTVTTLAATGQDEFHACFTPLTSGFSYAEPGMESVKEAVTEKTCAVLLELIQGEGGVIPMPEKFVKELRAFCTEKKILMMVDEVQTGIGRTGTFYCYQNYGILPDVVTSAKGIASGLPLGACLCAEPFANILGPGTHGSTFGGNPVACAGALVVMSRLSSPEFLSDVKAKGKYLSEKLAEMPGISSVRGLGMMIGAKPAHGTAGEIAVKCAEQGLLILTAKEVLRLLPPLVITRSEADKGLAILREVLNTVQS